MFLAGGNLTTRMCRLVDLLLHYPFIQNIGTCIFQGIMDLKRKNDTEIDHVSQKLNKIRCASMSHTLLCQDTREYMLSAWNEKHNLEKQVGLGLGVGNVEVILHPFKLCVVKDFLSDSKFIQDLKDELFQLDFIYKRNDLYQYHQSADLSTIHSASIDSLKNVMKGQCRDWLQDVTGNKLNDKLTLNCSTYNHTDHLLCHDDQTEDRLIAFVLYLHSNMWCESDGGQLQMFDADENSQPKDVVRSIIPEHNSFVFFEVTSKSFHQVAEILTADRTRLSINGWFHGSANLPSEPFLETFPVFCTPQPMPQLPISSLIYGVYLDAEIQSNMATHFEEESEILLTDFLDIAQYLNVARALQCKDIRWAKRGPANRRHYHVAEEDSLPTLVLDVVNFLKSKEMFRILQNFTNLELAESEECSTSSNGDRGVGPRCTVEVQRWEAGCYTLVHDNDDTLKQQALDLNLFFNAELVESFHGGFISYIARDDDEELLTVIPQGNALALTFRDKETLRFVKYINNRLGNENLFHTISLTYYE